jgi:cathepsin B
VAIAACNLQSQNYFTPEKVESHKNPSFETYSYEEHPFKDYSAADIKKLVGLQIFSWGISPTVEEVANNLPEHFDSREQWPDCIHPIRDQGHCGSCWAHAASEVLSDRFCIASNGSVNVVLSPQDMVSCDLMDHGCKGGILTISWTYLKFFGIVSDACKPYVSGNGQVPSCPLFKKECENGETYKKFKASTFYGISSIEAIKTNILAKGPVETGFMVYEDFMSYKSGIYVQTSSKLLGGHAVKIVGWGKEGETEYWIVANSWSPKWGENGYFKIKMGECGIENVMAGEPQL